MKYLYIGLLVALLSGCGSDSKNNSTDIENAVSSDDFKKNHQVVVDAETGLTYRVMTVGSSDVTIIELKENETFLLSSNNDYSEKLVVQGKITIK